MSRRRSCPLAAQQPAALADTIGRAATADTADTADTAERLASYRLVAGHGMGHAR